MVDLHQIMHKRISLKTWNERDKELIDGLNNITVMHIRLGRLTEKVLKNQAKRHVQESWLIIKSSDYLHITIMHAFMNICK